MQGTLTGNKVLKERKIWLISDTHFWHDDPHGAMLVDCGRPADFHHKIRHHWKRMVGEDDLVYHLGDVYFGPRSRFMECVVDLPGYKILIKGNHDREKTEWYMNHGFIGVMEQVTIIAKMYVSRGQMCGFRVILSHKPIEIPTLDTYTTLNIHGHFHNNPPENCDQKLIDRLTPNHYLLSLEATNYKPVILQNVMLHNLLLKGK